MRKEWGALKAAPLSFLFLFIAGLALGYFLGAWYYLERLETLSTQLDSKDSQIGRYRVALGIDKTSGGALVELTNTELKAKAASTSAKVRALHQQLQRRDFAIAELKMSGKLNDKDAREQSDAIMRDVSEEFERTLRADTINVDNELRRRLGPRVLASIVGLPQTFYSASEGVPVGGLWLGPSGIGWSGAFLGVLADGIDQMAALLPTD